MSATIKAVLGLDTKPFEAGFARAKAKAKDASETMGKTFGKGFSGQGLDKFLGIGAVVAGFTAVIGRAKEARDEAARLGTPIDSATASVARLGDAFGDVKNGILDIGVKTLGVFTGIGENIGKQIVRLQGLANGKSIEESDKGLADSEAAGANADRLQKETADPAVKRNAEQLAKLKEDARRKEMNDFDLLNQLYKDRDKLTADSLDKNKTLADRLAAQVEIEKKNNEIKTLGAKIDREAADDKARATEAQTKLDKEAAAARAKAYDEEQADEETLARLQQERIEDAMTAEQKLAATVAAGRKALADLNDNPNDAKAAIKVEELRKKYDALAQSIRSANAALDGKAAPASGGDPDAGDRNEAGKIMKRGVVVSDEDRGRSRATTAKNAALEEQTRTQRITQSQGIGNGETKLSPFDDKALGKLDEVSKGITSLNTEVAGLIGKLK